MTDKVLINALLKSNQYDEKYLIENIDYIDPYTCLKSQHNLSPEFCFKYLYNKDDNNWVSYEDIVAYFDKNKKYTSEQLKKIHDDLFNTII